MVVVAWLVDGSAATGATISSEVDVVVVPMTSTDVVVTTVWLGSARASCCWVAEHDATITAAAHTHRSLTPKV